MKQLFITGTFRNDWNKAYNLRLAEALEKKGLTLFLPQRDAEQLGNRKETFLQDVKGVDNAQILVAIGTKTQTANWGFEIGYAYKSGKPVIVITDNEHAVELMCEGAAAKVIIPENIDEIEKYIDDLVTAIHSLLK
ncbi:MAG: hypothetical protein RI947_514 [Candidatus Parcubacteria bacterium]|jgi:nucleoside 2-deoxyribosyltransferase